MSEMISTPPGEARGLRAAMGRFASGVTVISTIHDDEVHGMTANGFMSVSLDPPLVLVSLGNGSRMHDLVSETGRYAVSVLAEDQVPISAHFARMALRPFTPCFERHHGHAFVEGALAHVGCSVTDAHRAGDHTLCIGTVEHLAHRPGKPLIFHSGAYREIQHVVMDDGLFSELPREP